MSRYFYNLSNKKYTIKKYVQIRIRILETEFHTFYVINAKRNIHKDNVFL